MKDNILSAILIGVCMIAVVSCKDNSNSNVDSQQEQDAMVAVDSSEVVSVEVIDEVSAAGSDEVSNNKVVGEILLHGLEQFGYKVFIDLLKREQNNLIYSPVSLSMTLGMLINGTSGDTRAEIMKAIGCPVNSLPLLNSLNKDLIKNLQKCDSMTVVSIANSLWYKKSLTQRVNPGFRSVVESDYRGEITSVDDFASQEAINLINAWSNRSTNGFIPILFGAPLSPEVSMVIANALYFKGNWAEAFDKNCTKRRTFFNASGEDLTVEMMSDTRFVPYYSTDAYSAISLPYDDDRFSMIVVLPNEGVGLEKVYSPTKISDFLRVAKKDKAEVRIVLPKFSLTYDSGLESILQNFGVKTIFTHEADLSEAFPAGDFSVDALAQIAKIEVNESGTEAAAETYGWTILCSDDEEEEKEIKTFIAERPFLFMITERGSSMPLFIGAVRELGD